MTDRERIYELVERVSDFSIKVVDKITELKQENSELKQRVAELENASKPKHKFRAMTIGEFCKRFNGNCDDCPYRYINCRSKENKPCKPYSKYILIEVKK